MNLRERFWTWALAPLAKRKADRIAITDDMRIAFAAVNEVADRVKRGDATEQEYRDAWATYERAVWAGR